MNPPLIYGPFAPGFSVAPGNYYALSTVLYVYRLLNPKGNFPHFPGYQDVRDVAAAHVLALTSPPTTEVGRKRIILSSPYDLNYTWLINLIAEKRPVLKDRLTRVPAPVFPSDKNDIDFKRIEDVLGFRKEDYKGVEETVLEMVDNLIEVEKEWIAKGVRIDIPLELS